jgi:glutaredoxin
MSVPETSTTPIKVYWQPGCSSCLKTKEFLIEHDIEFESINVLEDENGFRELADLGLRLVPIVARGEDWANGAVFRDVARVAGFEWLEREMLPPAELIKRIDTILAVAADCLAQIPENQLDTLLPDRPRTYRELAYHIFQIPEVFLEHVAKGSPYTYEALISKLPPNLTNQDELIEFCNAVRFRLARWWQQDGGATDFSQPGEVYYGDVNLHEVLERTGWHSGQHTRQLILTLEKLGISPVRRLTEADLAGLPLPKNVWDNEKSWA